MLRMQVLVTGKISQAVVVAAAAYRDTDDFRARTGIDNSQLIDDEFHTNTHVSCIILVNRKTQVCTCLHTCQQYYGL